MSGMSTQMAAQPDRLLRRALTADAIVVAMAGLALALSAGKLADPLGLSVSLLRLTGIGLLPYAAVLTFIATRSSISRAAAWTIVGLNLCWTVASIGVLFTSLIDPSGWGVGFIVIQAVLVAIFAEVEGNELRRSR